MSDAIEEETDLELGIRQRVYDNEAPRSERGERNCRIILPRSDTDPPDSVDGNQNCGPVEVNRRRRRRPSTDETDYEGIKDPTTDHEDEREPRNSDINPSDTEGTVEASQSPDDATTARYFQKKWDALFFAVDYNQKEKMEEILNEVEPSTRVKLLTWPDTNGRPCIMKAITRQSLNCIRPLLEHLKTLNFDSFDMNKMDALQSHDKKNVLHVAAQMVRLDQEIINTIDIDLVMDELADSKDSNGTTPLIVACQYQNHPMAQRLVRAKAKIDHVDNNGYSPIYWAAARGSAETLRLFLDHGARDTTNQLELFKKRELYHNKGTILLSILKSQCPKTLQVCLDIDNGRDHIMNCLKEELDSDRTFIHAVCETPLVSLVKLAIEDSEQVLESLDDDGVTPLIKATEAGQLDIVKLILSKDSGRKSLSLQKRSTKETALMIACKKRFHEIVKFIMENSDTNMNLGQMHQDNRNVFHHAAKHDEILCVMIDICRRTEKYKNYKDYLNLKDNDGYVALHHAATNGSYKNVKLLLQNDVPYDTLSSSSRTALHYAAYSNIETVEALLEFVKTKINKEDAVKQFIDAVDSRLQTSLHIAASLGKWQTVSVLLKNGAAIKCDEENETPLHIASYVGCTRTVQLLIQNNPAIVNRENRVGETPAMFAAVNGQTKTLEMLVYNNANLCAQSKTAKTCLDWAVLNRQADTAKVILKSDNWRKIMKKSDVGADGLLARMVKYMPNVAIDVLNKCEETKHPAEYDFFALQTTGEKQSREKITNNVTAMEALETMLYYSRNECLNHVVVQRFLDQKWSLRARKWYLGCLFIYAIFLLSFTTYISLFTEGYPSDDLCMIISVILCYVFAILNVIKELLQLFHRKSEYFSMVSNYLDLVMYICVFIFLPYDKKSNMQVQAGAIAIFLGWINFTWFLKRFRTYGIYIIMAKKIFVTLMKSLIPHCTIIPHDPLLPPSFLYKYCIIVSLSTELPAEEATNSRGILIFLLLCVFVPVSFFIIAFSMTFFVLLHKQVTVQTNGTTSLVVPDENAGFGNIFRSFITSFAMMVGEVDYGDIFLQQTGKNFVLIQLFLVLFLVIMSILLMNLLTGLAVGDIGVIMRRSIAEKRILRAMLIVDLDKHLNKYPGFEAEYLEPLITQSLTRNSCAMSYVLSYIMDKMFPPLDIAEEKSQECEITGIKEQLNSVQNILEEIRSLSESQVTSTRKNREFIQPRRNTFM